MEDHPMEHTNNISAPNQTEVGETATGGANPSLDGGADDAAVPATAAAVGAAASATLLCASCDYCRSRKTKCDGKRPCSNCLFKYMKKNKIASAVGIDPEEVECVYSPAKRRGPTPGRSTNSLPDAAKGPIRKPKSAGHMTHAPNDEMTSHANNAALLNHPFSAINAEWNNPQQMNANAFGATLGNNNAPMGMAQLHQLSMGNEMNRNVGNNDLGLALPPQFQQQQNSTNMQVQLQMLQQQMQQQQMQQQQQQMQQQMPTMQQQLQAFNHQPSHMDAMMNNGSVGPTNSSTLIPNNTSLSMAAAAAAAMEPSAQRRKLDEMNSLQMGQTSASNNTSLPRTIMQHTHLIDRDDPEGSRLRAYYKLSMDELFRLPATPTDEEYCNTNGNSTAGGANGPSGRHLAALSATRFAEAAIGAIVHNEVGLAMELCNAVVHCLRESIQEKTMDSTVMFEVAKAYFLLGVFRAFRGDMARYFKYRRVCLTYLSKLDGDERTLLLLAAMSYLDSWTYMMYNGNESDVPNIDGMIPPVLRNNSNNSFYSPVEAKYGVKTDMLSIASNPKNKNWLQGPPAVYLNNEAPLHARSLDAISCAVRYCCDQANARFASLASENDPSPGDKMAFHQVDTPTTSAVLTNENELCNRNMVASSYVLMRQYESNTQGNEKCEGLHLIISAMDAFLESDDGDLDGGFTDSQIQSLLSVCNSAVENPLLLHHAGPTYHLVTNAAILLCHLLNGMHAMKTTTQFGPMEATMFEEVLDTLVSVRKLLTVHRRKLPVRLRCHGIPRPSFDSIVVEGQPLIDLGETTLCPCRSCQGFVLLACSPSVAAERARSAQSRMDVAVAQEAEAVDLGELSQPMPNGNGNGSGGARGDMGAEFDLDDDALLTLISSLISS